ncbi:unnamed protein product [Menidia menidia]|uniref:(Atlantic silverside) hypothetical protein n=1 Tax=Menidia menidia TaxID=238744 RepID=A0A8S4B7V4_9TELE|nr:unnamed protein product [Menidia menidia]
MFAVRIVTADYYLASPVKDLDVGHSEFRDSERADSGWPSSRGPLPPLGLTPRCVVSSVWGLKVGTIVVLGLQIHRFDAKRGVVKDPRLDKGDPGM